MWKWVKRVMVVVMLLLSSAIGVLWVGSYFVGRAYGYAWREHRAVATPLRSVWIGMACGGIALGDYCLSGRQVDLVGFNTGFWFKQGTPNGYPYMPRSPSDNEYLRGAGFQIIRCGGLGIPTQQSIYLLLPFWLPLLLTSLFPAIVAVRHVRRRRESRRGFPVVVSEDGAGGGEGSQKSG